MLSVHVLILKCKK